jgi:nucleoside-diphosphate-sugar epimerase
MHVFVTGATGFIGLHTVLALTSAGHTVRLGVRNAQKMQMLYAHHGLDITDFAVGEITDEVSVGRALEDCDAVVHTAALVSLDPGKAAKMHKTNVQGTRTVIGGAVERGIKSIVYVSSAAALFDSSLPVINENVPLAQAKNAYAHSKVDADQYVRGLIDQGANIAVTYPTGVIGPDDPALSEGNQSLQFILNNFHVNTSSGIQMVDVRDLADIQVKLLEGNHAGKFLTGGHYTSWRDLGLLLDSVTGARLTKIPVPGMVLRGIGSLVDLIGKVKTLDTPATREAVEFATRWVLCDDSKLRTELDIRYRPLETTLADTIQSLAQAGHVGQRWGKADDTID